jgi:predicted DNA-binding transcriptional regulator AlpA
VAQLGHTGNLSTLGLHSSMSKQTTNNSNHLTILPRLLIAREVATAIRKSPKTVYKMAHEGRIPFILIDSNMLFDLEEITKWIDDHRMAA